MEKTWRLERNISSKTPFWLYKERGGTGEKEMKNNCGRLGCWPYIRDRMDLKNGVYFVVKKGRFFCQKKKQQSTGVPLWSPSQQNTKCFSLLLSLFLNCSSCRTWSWLCFHSTMAIQHNIPNNIYLQSLPFPTFVWRYYIWFIIMWLKCVCVLR